MEERKGTREPLKPWSLARVTEIERATAAQTDGMSASNGSWVVRLSYSRARECKVSTLCEEGLGGNVACGQAVDRELRLVVTVIEWGVVFRRQAEERRFKVRWTAGALPLQEVTCRTARSRPAQTASTAAQRLPPWRHPPTPNPPPAPSTPPARPWPSQARSFSSSTVPPAPAPPSRSRRNPRRIL